MNLRIFDVFFLVVAALVCSCSPRSVNPELVKAGAKNSQNDRSGEVASADLDATECARADDYIFTWDIDGDSEEDLICIIGDSDDDLSFERSILIFPTSSGRKEVRNDSLLRSRIFWGVAQDGTASVAGEKPGEFSVSFSRYTVSFVWRNGKAIVKNVSHETLDPQITSSEEQKVLNSASGRPFETISGEDLLVDDDLDESAPSNKDRMTLNLGMKLELRTRTAGDLTMAILPRGREIVLVDKSEFEREGVSPFLIATDADADGVEEIFSKVSEEGTDACYVLFDPIVKDGVVIDLAKVNRVFCNPRIEDVGALITTTTHSGYLLTQERHRLHSGKAEMISESKDLDNEVRRIAVRHPDGQFAISLQSRAARQRLTVACVNKERVYIHINPDRSSRSIGYLINDDEVSIMDGAKDASEEVWIRVRFVGAHQTQGWVRKEDLDLSVRNVCGR